MENKKYSMQIKEVTYSINKLQTVIKTHDINSIIMFFQKDFRQKKYCDKFVPNFTINFTD